MMTDKELLDGLESLQTRPVICRDSTLGRGWRLHETTRDGSTSNLRLAIEVYLNKRGKNETTIR